MRTYFCLISCWCLWLLCLPETAHSSAGSGPSLHSVSKATAAPMGSIATIIFFGASVLPFFLYFGFLVSSRRLWQELHAYENGNLLANEAD